MRKSRIGRFSAEEVEWLLRNGFGQISVWMYSLEDGIYPARYLVARPDGSRLGFVVGVSKNCYGTSLDAVYEDLVKQLEGSLKEPEKTSISGPSPHI